MNFSEVLKKRIHMYRCTDKVSGRKDLLSAAHFIHWYWFCTAIYQEDRARHFFLVFQNTQ